MKRVLWWAALPLALIGFAIGWVISECRWAGARQVAERNSEARIQRIREASTC